MSDFLFIIGLIIICWLVQHERKVGQKTPLTAAIWQDAYSIFWITVAVSLILYSTKM